MKKKSGILKSSVMNVILKPVGMFISFVYTPMLLSYLGEEKYGIWVTILSIINWIAYFDLGIGNGLRNLLAIEIANSEYDEAKKSNSTAYMVLSIVSLIIFVVGVFVGSLLNWKSILGTNLNVKPVILISFLFICVNFVLSLKNNAYYAIQKSEIVALNATLIQLINLIGVFLISRITTGNLMLMGCLFGISGIFINIVFSFSLWRKKTYLIPNTKSYDRSKLNEILPVGIMFFVLQMAALILFTSDSILISSLYSAKQVTPYNTVYKVYGIAYSIFGALLAPFWSKYTVAYNNKQFNWICKMVKKLVGIWIGCSVVVLASIPIYQKVSDIWLGTHLYYDKYLISFMAIYNILLIYSGIMSTVLNGIGELKGQMVIGIIQAIVNIPLSIFFAKVLNLKTAGICLGTVVCLVFGCITMTYIYYRKVKVDAK